MNKIIPALLAATFLFSHAASAATKTDFDCTTKDVIEKNAPTRVKFTVSDLDSTKPVMESDSGTEDDPITMSPKDSVLDLNDNWSFQVKGGKLTITSDGDGCQWTTFVLYQNSGFKNGYVGVKGDSGCGAGSFYSKVECKVTNR